MILIAIGANLPGPDGASARETCARAAAALARLPGLRMAGQSRWYATAPQPPSGQPDYINGVIGLEGVPPDPAILLGWLQDIEAASGRVRGAANAARTLDLDIIDIDGMCRAAPDPILPHPRAHLREFVLRPLLDVVPGWRHPRTGEAGAALLAGLPAQGARVLQAGTNATRPTGRGRQARLWRPRAGGPWIP